MITFTVNENVREAKDVVTLKLDTPHGQLPYFLPGQFITVYFPDLDTPEGKAYSISNPPGERTLNITVKAMGEFSNHLCALRPGEIVTASEPYGYFYTESADTPLIFAAAGIGIAPFRSMISWELVRHPARHIELGYSNRTDGDIVFKELLAHLEDAHERFCVVHFLTREKRAMSRAVARRMTAQDLFERAARLPNSADAEFFLCGSISFTGDLWKGLRALGVPEEKIYTEAFFK